VPELASKTSAGLEATTHWQPSRLPLLWYLQDAPGTFGHTGVALDAVTEGD
jgi:hypothetical protein